MHACLILTYLKIFSFKMIIQFFYYYRTISNIFPPRASCLYVEAGAVVDTFNYYSGLCTLPWNSSNFYAFLALWWWLLLVCSVVFFDIFASFGTLTFPRLRMFSLGYYVSSKLSFLNYSVGQGDRKKMYLAVFVQGCQ